jgi:hypothetical protein
MEISELIKIPASMTRIKQVLLGIFTLLLLFQVAVGFRNFEDYLVIFVYVLFLNDLYYKIKKPQLENDDEEPIARRNRIIMSVVFLVLFTLPFLIDSYNVSSRSLLLFYKLGFVLWAQVLLVDSYQHYKQTRSKKWLFFANTAVLLSVISAFVG